MYRSEWIETVGNEAGKAQHDQNFSLQSFLASIAASAGICVLAVVAFSLLKDQYPSIYCNTSQGIWSPNTSIPSLPSGPWAWIRPVVTLPDETIIRERGLDAFLLLRLLRTALVIFGPLALVLIPILVPLNVTATSDLHDVNVSTGLNRLSCSNIRAGQWSRYWVQLGACLGVVVYVGFVMTRELRLLRRLRRTALLHPRNRSSARTILVTDIPREWVKEDILANRLRGFCARFHRGDVVIHTIRDYRSVTDKVAHRNKLVDRLEDVATRRSERDAGLGGARSQHAPHSRRSRWCRWLRYPRSTSSVDMLQDARQIRALTDEIEEALQVPSRFPLLPCAFLQFPSPVTAHILCQVVHTDQPFCLSVHRLDSVEDGAILWSNVGHSWLRRLRDRTIATVLMLLVSIVWAAPISLTGFLSQLASLNRVFSWAEGVASLNPHLLVVLQGILPQLVVAALMNILPYILTVLVKRQAYVSCAAAERCLQFHYFLFLYLQVFIVVSIASALSVVLPALMESPQSTPIVLATNLPKASNYFLSYLLLYAFSQCAVLLIRPLDWFGRFQWPWTSRSPRARWARETTPPVARMGLIVPIVTNLMCLAIIFSVIAPLILACATIAFALLWLVYRYLVIYVVEVPVNSGGMLHWQALHQLFVGLYTFELCQVGLFALASSHGPLACMVLAVGGTAVFHYLVYSQIRPTIEYLPSSISVSDEELHDLKTAVPGRERFPIFRAIWIPNGLVANQVNTYLPVSSEGLTLNTKGGIAYKYVPPGI